MDVFRGFSLLFILSLFMLSACTQNAEEIFPAASDDCLASALKTQFVVTWKNGNTTVETGNSREQFIEDFVEKNISAIEHVEFDQVISLEPNWHPSVLTEVNEPNNWGIEVSEAHLAWQMNLTGDGVTVAVIDSGVDISHPQLAQQVFTNTGESGVDAQGANKETNGIDDDNNGYVDDFQGWNFISKTNEILDYGFHGTHVAGIVAAEHSDTAVNNSYVQGVAPGAKIMPLPFISALGTGLTSDAIKAIEYAVENGAKVINASWGGPYCSESLRKKVSELDAQDVLFISAAGNNFRNIDYSPEYPAAYRAQHQITVGSITAYLGMAEHSNYGQKGVHLFAPGLEITSTIPGNSTRSLNGTSMATPFVAGAAAILWGAAPNAAPEQIKEALLQGAHINPEYINVSQGRLNIKNSLDFLENMLFN